MNDAQQIFTVFFAISWGIVSNVLPRWKPFHYALCFRLGFWKPTLRAVVGFVLLNVLPWSICVFVLFAIRGSSGSNMDWNAMTFFDGVQLICRAMLPGLVPFGCYRLWIAVVQTIPDAFYAKNAEELKKLGLDQKQEPNQEKLRLTKDFFTKREIVQNYIFAVLYLAFFPLLAWLCTA